MDHGQLLKIPYSSVKHSVILNYFISLFRTHVLHALDVYLIKQVHPQVTEPPPPYTRFGIVKYLITDAIVSRSYQVHGTNSQKYAFIEHLIIYELKISDTVVIYLFLLQKILMTNKGTNLHKMSDPIKISDPPQGLLHKQSDHVT